MDNKEKWAEEVLNSLKGIKSAVPKENLFDKIRQKIPKGKQRDIIPLRHLGWAAVAASVVIIVNIYTLKFQMDSNQDTVENNDEQISLLTDYTF